jgi:hypothetical protein
MRITDKDLACGTVFSCKVDKNDFLITKALKMGYEEREGLQPSHLLCYLLHPHVYTPLYRSPLYEISHAIFPQAIILCFPGVLFWRFLNGSTELLVGGLLLQGLMLGVVRHL